MKKQVSETFADTVQSLEDNELMTQQQQTYNSSYHTTIHMARVRQGVFTCDGWQVTLSDPHVKWRPVALRRGSQKSYIGLYLYMIPPFISYHCQAAVDLDLTLKKLVVDLSELVTVKQLVLDFCSPIHSPLHHHQSPWQQQPQLSALPSSDDGTRQNLIVDRSEL